MGFNSGFKGLMYVAEGPVEVAFFLAEVGIEYAYGQLCTYIQSSLAGILHPIRRNLIGRSKTAPPSVLLSSSILSPSSSDFYFHALKEKIGPRLKYVTTLGFFLIA